MANSSQRGTRQGTRGLPDALPSLKRDWRIKRSERRSETTDRRMRGRCTHMRLVLVPYTRVVTPKSVLFSSLVRGKMGESRATETEREDRDDNIN